MEASQPSSTVFEILGRALVDDDFRSEFFESRDAALAGYSVTEEDLAVFDRISRDDFEKQVKSFQSYVVLHWPLHM